MQHRAPSRLERDAERSPRPPPGPWLSALGKHSPAGTAEPLTLPLIINELPVALAPWRGCRQNAGAIAQAASTGLGVTLPQAGQGGWVQVLCWQHGWERGQASWSPSPRLDAAVSQHGRLPDWEALPKRQVLPRLREGSRAPASRLSLIKGHP